MQQQYHQPEQPQPTKTRRALLSIVVNAQPGNISALSHKNSSSSSSSNAMSSTTTSNRCGVAGCHCEHFMVQPHRHQSNTTTSTASAAAISYGVCTQCNHGAMYHHLPQHQKKNNSNHNMHMQPFPQKQQHQNSASVSPLPKPIHVPQHYSHQQTEEMNLMMMTMMSSQQQQFFSPTNSVSSPTFHSHQQMNANNNNNKNNNSNASTFALPTAATMNLTSILNFVDNLERTAVLKTMRCEQNDDVSHNPQQMQVMSNSSSSSSTSLNGKLSHTARCSLLSEALTLLVRACDVVNDRIVFLKRLLDINHNHNNNNSETAHGNNHNNNNNNNSFSAETCLNERNILTRRFEQLTQHSEKVKKMLQAAENFHKNTTKSTNNNSNSFSNSASFLNLQQNNTNNYMRSSSQQSHRYNSMMLMGAPVEHVGDNSTGGADCEGGGNHDYSFTGKYSREDSTASTSSASSVSIPRDFDNHRSTSASSSSTSSSSNQNHELLFNRAHLRDSSNNQFAQISALMMNVAMNPLSNNNKISTGPAAGVSKNNNNSGQTSFGNSREGSQQRNNVNNNNFQHQNQQQHQVQNNVRLCKDCLETTLATALYCHNCGNTGTTCIAQIRAPSPDPVYE